MDTTENKTEQYTKKPYPEFKPETDVIKHYMTDVGHDVAYNPITGHWFTGTRIKRPTWFMELSPPMEVKDAELMTAIEWGYKQCEKGNNLEQAFINFKNLSK